MDLEWECEIKIKIQANAWKSGCNFFSKSPGKISSRFKANKFECLHMLTR